MASLCPHCGYNITRDDPITIGKWTLYPDSVFFRGRNLHLTNGEAGLLYTVAKAAPRAVQLAAIGNRISHADNVAGVASVLACRLRRKLGRNMPIETVPGAGYRWRRA